MKKVGSFISYAYIIAIGVVLAFYYDDGYFNMLAAKSFCYRVIAFIFLFVGIIYLNIFIIRTKDVGVKIKKSFNMLDYIMIAFLLSALLSCRLSYNKLNTFFGIDGWYMGAFNYITLVFFYFFVSRFLEYDKKIVWGILFVSAFIILLLGILNAVSIDPLSLHEKLLEKDMFRYSSTMGNINTFVGYISMITPIIIYKISSISLGDYKEKYKYYITVIPLNILLSFAFINVFTCNSDGIYLGIGIVLFIMFVYFMSDKKYMLGFCKGMINFSISASVVVLLKKIYKEKMVNIVGISEVILDKNIYLYIGLFFLILMIALIIVDKKNIKCSLFTCKNMRIVTLIFGAISSCLVIRNVISDFNDSWGTNRGFIWKMSINIFKRFGIKDKIFGYGVDGYGIIAEKMYAEDIKNIFRLRLLNAHNEFLQYLVTMGILGFIAYTLLWVYIIKTLIKNRNSVKKIYIAYFGALGYMGQAIVNNPQAFNVAYLFLLFAIAKNMEKYNKNL